MNRPVSLQARLWKESGVLALLTLLFFASLVLLSGCENAPKSDQALKDQAAQATQQVKQDAQEAAANAKVAAAEAERKVDDIAAGVKEGLNNGKSAGVSSGAVDINSASAAQLTGLPGITAPRAHRIIDGRPYGSPHDLVAKGIVSEAEYRRISDRIAAQ